MVHKVIVAKVDSVTEISGANNVQVAHVLGEEVIAQLQSLPKHLAMMKEGSGFKHHYIFEEEHYSKLENSVVEDVMSKFRYEYNIFGENTPVKDWDEIYDELIPLSGEGENSDQRINYKHLLM